jgi:hypothetical protein
VRRIVSLGDSFAYGIGVELDDTYGRLLERALNRRPGERWEVVQLARPGIGTVEEVAQLEDEGLAYKPDVVVIGFVLNDCELSEAADERRERELLEQERGRQPQNGPALWRFVWGRIRATLVSRERVARHRSQFEPDYPGWLECQKAMQRLGVLCRQRDVPLVVMIFPLFGNPLDGRYPFDRLHVRAAGLARAAGATVLDLLPVYRGLRWEILVVNGPRDEHPNEIAHRIAARTLYELLDTQILPRLSTPNAATAGAGRPRASRSRAAAALGPAGPAEATWAGLRPEAGAAGCPACWRSGASARRWPLPLPRARASAARPGGRLS